MEYTVTKNAGIGGCTDVTAENDSIYAIQRSSQYAGGRLCVLNRDMELKGSLEGIGGARQIEVKNGIAAVSAREDGLWLIDVRGDTPRLLAHYQTIEFATGITLYANLVFVSCRQHGVEIIDIADPKAPRHIGIIRMGEVQSACVADGILYGGVWGGMKVVMVDITDINDPKTLGEIPLMGRGDGVTVRDGILYAVTGQHKRGLKDPQPTDSCFGNGNGVEMYDVRDPKNPRLLAADSFGYGYSIRFDTWDAMLCGDRLVCCNSILGVYGYDAKTLTRELHIGFENNEPVFGITSAEGCIFIATDSGLYRFDSLHFDDFYRADTDEVICADKTPLKFEGDGQLVPRCRLPVLAVADAGDRLALACGQSGLYTVSKDSFEIISHTARVGFCSDVKVHGGRVYAAFAQDGFEVLELDTLKTVSKMTFDGGVYQLTVSKNGGYALIALDASEISLVDLGKFEVIARRVKKQGPLYGDNFASHCMGDGTMLAFWHRDGLVYTNPEAGDLELHDIFYTKDTAYMRFGPETGIDTDGENILYNIEGGYILLPMAAVNADTLTRYKTEQKLIGKLVVKDRELIAVERARGVITVTDISDITSPRHRLTLKTSASCGRPTVIDGKIYIPARHDGLLELIIPQYF